MSQNLKILRDGEKLAKVSFVTLLAIGIAELLAGFFSHSLTLTTDGADSLSDALISLIVWAGLRVSKKAPDDRFHFGYLRVESLAALMASIGMVIVATVFIYFAYLRLLSPQAITYPTLVLAVFLVAGIISLYRALQMRRLAKDSNLLSLKTDAYNSVKDATASFVGFSIVLILVAVSLPVLDAIGSIIIAVYIYTVAYISIRESSYVLLDAFNSPEVVEKIRQVIEGGYHGKVDSVRLRRVGPLIAGVIHVVADGRTTLDEIVEVRAKMKADLSREIEGLGRLTITFHTTKEGDTDDP
ncbi:MAG: cation diffusion facilitator family transporter [Thaumarchaeota archaeon]|nr:cation diffusion facilitator family transporter [Nitrososphaerota archaeon]